MQGTPPLNRTNVHWYYIGMAFRWLQAQDILPGVIGTIDCTHVKIPCPGGQDAELFHNRKGYFSINVQVVGGPGLEITNIVACWPGSVHDARIFDNSLITLFFLSPRTSWPSPWYFPSIF